MSPHPFVGDMHTTGCPFFLTGSTSPPCYAPESVPNAGVDFRPLITRMVWLRRDFMGAVGSVLPIALCGLASSEVLSVGFPGRETFCVTSY